jgi:predicted acetyltransferase
VALTHGRNSLFSQKTPYRKNLGDGLVLKSLGSLEDIERLAAFNGVIHDESVADMTRELILHHPNTRPEHWLYVEDSETTAIVSSLCLIPWKLRYGGVELWAGEMGIVGTLEAYRHRGLIRAQADRHAELLHQGSYDLSHIQGIPYFYRQFGYEYAVPLEGGWRVELHTVPDAGTEQVLHTFRQAGIEDLPQLVRLYDEAAQTLALHVLRSEAEWQYLLGPSTRTEMVAETWLVLGRDGRPVGYFRIPKHGFGEGLIVNETSHLDLRAAQATLHQVAALGRARGKPYIRLCLPRDSTLVHVARCRGAHDLGHYAWQIKLVDVRRTLLKIAPVLEHRIAGSLYAGLTRDICLNLYREAFELRFHDGKLTAVEALGFSDQAGIHIPPLLLAPLLLGYRSREELAALYHDLSIWGEWEPLVDVLFPKMTSFIYTIY